MNTLKRAAAFLLFLTALMAFAVSASASAESDYRPLQSGSYGDDVLRLKTRLYELGYFTSNKFNNRYTEDTGDRVKEFLMACSLQQSAAASAAVQELLFSDDAVSKKSGTNLSGKIPAMPENKESSPYRTLGPENNGDDMLRLKNGLKQAGFFAAKAETGAYNDTLAESIRAYQRSLGREENGIADPELQSILYGPAQTESAAPSAAASSGYTAVATPVPEVTPAPTSTPFGPSAAVRLPELTAEGFLADAGAQPFIHADRDDGHWYYISQNLSIEIVRMQNKRQNITWFETDIRCTPESLPQAFLAKGSREDGHNFLPPTKIAEQYDVILGISDDFYGYRWYNRNSGLKQGVIIRNGEIKADEPQPAGSKKWPYLEILALFDDGSMRTYESDEHTAQEYIDMGVIDTFAFGPILVHDGVIDQGLYDKTVVRYTDDEPRMALGCVAPYHYIIVTAKGRTSDSQGVTMHWLAERMKALGCENALNLDGGGTVALYFMGDVLNKVKNSTNLRDVSSMFGFSAQ